MNMNKTEILKITNSRQHDILVTFKTTRWRCIHVAIKPSAQLIDSNPILMFGEEN